MRPSSVEEQILVAEQSKGVATGPRPVFLVVDDNTVLCREIGRLLTAYGASILAGSLGDARRTLNRANVWSGIIVDIHLPDGSGLDLVAGARQMHPAIPVLVISGDLEAENINGACLPGVSFLAKPFKKKDILQFAEAAQACTDALTFVLRAHAERFGFSRGEADILKGAVQGEDRRQIAARRNCSLNTLQSQISSMIRKSGGVSFQELVFGVLREAVGLNARLSS